MREIFIEELKKNPTRRKTKEINRAGDDHQTLDFVKAWRVRIKRGCLKLARQEREAPIRDLDEPEKGQLVEGHNIIIFWEGLYDYTYEVIPKGNKSLKKS